MSNHELLELAAKAAGYEFRFSNDWHDKDKPQIAAEKHYGKDYDYWSPLEDDGDAFRLAVKCQIDVQFGPSSVDVNTALGMINIDVDSDPFAATRLAITRAAAQIGASIK